jgi:hypothetical protein
MSSIRSVVGEPAAPLPVPGATPVPPPHRFTMRFASVVVIGALPVEIAILLLGRTLGFLYEGFGGATSAVWLGMCAWPELGVAAGLAGMYWAGPARVGWRRAWALIGILGAILAIAYISLEAGPSCFVPNASCRVGD